MIPQVVLVTGSSTGLGRLTVETLARRGHTVFASMRGVTGKNAAAAEELRALARAEGLVLEPLELDVTDDASVQAAVAEIVARAGQVDVVVHNAGFGVAGLVEASSIAQVHQQFEVNLYGVLRVNQAVLPHMRRQRSGLLVYISSIASRLGSPPTGLYCATKAALDALARTQAVELREFGIDTAIIQPGQFATEFGNNLVRADRPEVAADYPLMSSQLEASVEGLRASFAASAGIASDPQELADLIASLVALPQGQRPLHSALGFGAQGIDRVNAAIMAYELGILQLFGLAEAPADQPDAPQEQPAPLA